FACPCDNQTRRGRSKSPVQAHKPPKTPQIGGERSEWTDRRIILMQWRCHGPKRISISSKLRFPQAFFSGVNASIHFRKEPLRPTGAHSPSKRGQPPVCEISGELC